MKIIINLFYISIVILTSCKPKDNSIESSNKVKIDSTKSSSIEEVVEPEIPQKSCSYENKTFSLGLGIFDPSEKFKLYNDSNLTDLYSEINIYENGHEVDFCAKFHKSDYGIMQFVCLDSTEKYYKVVINESDFKYVSKIDKSSFLTWEEYILTSFGINAKYPSTLVIKNNPEHNATTIDSTESMNTYCPIKISGDWVNIKYFCSYENDVVEECSLATNCSKTG